MLSTDDLVSGPNFTAGYITPTNSVDVMPTLVRLSSGEIPNWHEGELLSGLGVQQIPGRSIYTLYALKNAAFALLTWYSVAMRKDNYELILFSGYYHGIHVELYDLENDPEELNDLSVSMPSVVPQMRDELLANINAVNAKYKSRGKKSFTH